MANIIYNRQLELGLYVPKKVGVIGLGGVGSWVALNLALTGAEYMVLVDHDRIEPHNLNRTPYALRHIGMNKAEAMAEIILERREINVLPIPKRLEDCLSFLLDELKGCNVVVDCRDNFKPPLPEDVADKQMITGGYDGFNITIHVNPKYEKIWGDEPVTYTVTPSWLVPPQLIANIVTAYICCNELHTQKEVVFTCDIRKLLAGVILNDKRNLG